MIILQLANLANNSFSRFFSSSKLLLLFIKLFFCWAISYNTSFAVINSSHLSQPWKISALAIIKGMPAIDNGQKQTGARIGISNFFYNDQKNLELGGDFSLAYLKTSKHKHKQDFSKSIYILSPALVVRWYMANLDNLRPYLTVGVGPSLLSNNDFEGRRLGPKFSFQDIIGVGLKLVRSNDLDLGVYIIHYSNASLSKDNRGITTPLAIKLSYGF